MEKISKSDILTALKKATRYTKEREYKKILHGPKILQYVDTSKVRLAAPHCNRLFTTLAEKIGVAL
jgi:hypothetical protein